MQKADLAAHFQHFIKRLLIRFAMSGRGDKIASSETEEAKLPKPSDGRLDLARKVLHHSLDLAQGVLCSNCAGSSHPAVPLLIMGSLVDDPERL